MHEGTSLFLFTLSTTAAAFEMTEEAAAAR
jgi:hypothetical protein